MHEMKIQMELRVASNFPRRRRKMEVNLAALIEIERLHDGVIC